MRFTMQPVPPDEAADFEILEVERPDPDAVGTGEVDHDCGACGALVVDAAFRGELTALFVKCPACGALNRPTD